VHGGVTIDDSTSQPSSAHTIYISSGNKSQLMCCYFLGNSDCFCIAKNEFGQNFLRIVFMVGVVVVTKEGVSA
jgi:hypothetical protein